MYSWCQPSKRGRERKKPVSPTPARFLSFLYGLVQEGSFHHCHFGTLVALEASFSSGRPSRVNDPLMVAWMSSTTSVLKLVLKWPLDLPPGTPELAP